MSLQYDIVDAFILHEGNVSIYGVPKEPIFLQRFQQGWLKQCQDKVSVRKFIKNVEESRLESDSYGWNGQTFI